VAQWYHVSCKTIILLEIFLFKIFILHETFIFLEHSSKFLLAYMVKVEHKAETERTINVHSSV
jgi:hypothetical protein